MSFDAIPADVLIHHLAPLFRFESSVDPVRQGEIGHDGHRLLHLRKFTPDQRALVLRKMDRVTTCHISQHYRTECSSIGLIYLSRVFAGAIDDRWVRLPANELVVVVWNGNHWEPRPHPILLWLSRIVTRPRGFGKTI